ncbi:Rhomboid-related protein 1 [Bagarius yarrelli]|uniref:rhomboid protease n=1 Tax=Bagarius yarrelli TaxID=175774 RepID=A0A556U1C8_BAGYA|nr:Rhomboid-related protein 1 [Bagarius yarrelli]
MMLALVQSDQHGHVCYQELIELLSSKRSSSFRRAIANGRRTLQREILLDETGLGVYKRFVRYVAYEILPCETDRRWYFHQNRICPPPVFMAIVTIVQAGRNVRAKEERAVASAAELFLQTGGGLRNEDSSCDAKVTQQLGFNALLQLMIGVPLEMVHGILRISLLYMAGVVAGSLTVSITDMRAPVVGGSGGVYALCSAHLANVVMNWAGMKCPYKLLRMILALVCMSSEVGRAVWLRFSPPLPSSGPQPSFMAHLSGAIVGISMGLLILRSYEESLHKQCSWWVLIFSFITFLLFAIFWNIFAYELLGVQIPSPP